MDRSIKDLAWVAGFLEGEGSFGWYSRGSCPRVSAPQVQKEPLDRLQSVFGGKLRGFQPKQENRQPQWIWQVNGQRAIEVMMTLYALMSPKRQEKIREVITNWKNYISKRGPNKQLCFHGHPWNQDNIFTRPNGYRECLTCRKSRQDIYKVRYRGRYA